MALKIDKRCKICQRCVDDPSFVRRLFASRAYVPGGESLLQIAALTGANYKALGRHTSRHQGISNYELKVQTTRQAAKRDSSAIVKQRVVATDARQNILDMLSKLVEEHGDIEIGRDITLKDALGLTLKGAKDADDVAAKRKDQELDVFKLMTSARSGATPAVDATDEPFDPWSDVEEAELAEHPVA